jgi:pimeloyl-ACP methyl ester carboxylesterase
MQLAVLAPDRVRSLVLVDSAGFGSGMAPVLRLIAIKPLGKLLLRPGRFGARRTVRALFGDPAFVTEDRVWHALLMARRPGAARTFQETGSALATWRGMRPEWRHVLLSSLYARPVPTLAVWATATASCPPLAWLTCAGCFPTPICTCSPAPATCLRSSAPRNGGR